MPWVYILQCADGSYYTGMSRGQELDQRISEHAMKLSPGAYTASRLPVKLVYSEYFDLVAGAVERASLNTEGPFEAPPAAVHLRVRMRREIGFLVQIDRNLLQVAPSYFRPLDYRTAPGSSFLHVRREAWGTGA